MRRGSAVGRLPTSPYLYLSLAAGVLPIAATAWLMRRSLSPCGVQANPLARYRLLNARCQVNTLVRPSGVASNETMCMIPAPSRGRTLAQAR